MPVTLGRPRIAGLVTLGFKALHECDVLLNVVPVGQLTQADEVVLKRGVGSVQLMQACPFQ